MRGQRRGGRQAPAAIDQQMQRHDDRQRGRDGLAEILRPIRPSAFGGKRAVRPLTGDHLGQQFRHVMIGVDQPNAGDHLRDGSQVSGSDRPFREIPAILERLPENLWLQARPGRAESVKRGQHAIKQVDMGFIGLFHDEGARQQFLGPGDQRLIGGWRQRQLLGQVVGWVMNHMAHRQLPQRLIMPRNPQPGQQGRQPIRIGPPLPDQPRRPPGQSRIQPVRHDFAQRRIHAAQPRQDRHQPRRHRQRIQRRIVSRKRIGQRLDPVAQPGKAAIGQQAQQVVVRCVKCHDGFTLCELRQSGKLSRGCHHNASPR